MTASSVRMMKEFRLLAWPWLAVTTASLLAFATVSSDLKGFQEAMSLLCQVGIFAGLPLLAALSLGAEFQYNTLGLNFAQPIDRRDVWQSKFTITVLALLLPAILFVASQRLSSHFDRNAWWMLIGWLVVTSAAAFPWTLIARSTVGGFALNAGSSTIAFMAITFAAESFRNEGGLSTATTIVIALALSCYSAAMVWLGRRMFLQFQAVGGSQSAEAAFPGAHLFPRAVADWFRCRPRGLFANLVRREFRLLRFVWPLTLLSALAWLFVLKVHALPASDTKSYLLPILFLTVMIGLLIAVLAGSLSMGEEKSWGTHDWHLTLPISPSLLWFVKLSMSVVTSVICSALVPLAILLIAGWRTGNVYFYVEKTTLWFIPLEAAGLTFVAFWCACMMKGTVRAALLTFPAMMTIFSGAPVGTWLGEFIGERSKPLFDLLATHWGIVTITTHTAWLEQMFYMPEQLAVVLMIPLFGVALLQSRLMFREQAGEGPVRILRRLRPLFLITFSSALAFTLFFLFCFRASARADEAAWQLNVAIQALHPDSAADGAPIHISARELARVSPLSADTEHWLGDANILIIPGPPSTLYGAWRVTFGSGRRLTSTELWQPYSAVVRLENNTTCLVTFQVSPKYRWGYARAICS
jgi:hypothetical protein